jgi:hypothetical protein
MRENDRNGNEVPLYMTEEAKNYAHMLNEGDTLGQEPSSPVVVYLFMTSSPDYTLQKVWNINQ